MNQDVQGSVWIIRLYDSSIHSQLVAFQSFQIWYPLFSYALLLLFLVFLHLNSSDKITVKLQCLPLKSINFSCFFHNFSTVHCISELSNVVVLFSCLYIFIVLNKQRLCFLYFWSLEPSLLKQHMSWQTSHYTSGQDSDDGLQRSSSRISELFFT
jgi:hypothetical protein